VHCEICLHIEKTVLIIQSMRVVWKYYNANVDAAIKAKTVW